MSSWTLTTYRTKNWSDNDEALRQCGFPTIRFDPEMDWDATPTGKRGRQPTYGETTIQACLTMMDLFGRALRQRTGS